MFLRRTCRTTQRSADRNGRDFVAAQLNISIRKNAKATLERTLCSLMQLMQRNWVWQHSSLTAPSRGVQRRPVKPESHCKNVHRSFVRARLACNHTV